jgi:hypothetical protein
MKKSDQTPMERKADFDKRAYSIAEAAKYACRGYGTIRNWILSGQLPCEELPSGRGEGSHIFRLIRKVDLDAFLDKHYNYKDDTDDPCKTNRPPLVLE